MPTWYFIYLQWKCWSVSFQTSLNKTRRVRTITKWLKNHRSRVELFKMWHIYLMHLFIAEKIQPNLWYSRKFWNCQMPYWQYRVLQLNSILTCFRTVIIYAVTNKKMLLQIFDTLLRNCQKQCLIEWSACSGYNGNVSNENGNVSPVIGDTEVIDEICFMLVELCLLQKKYATRFFSYILRLVLKLTW